MTPRHALIFAAFLDSTLALGHYYWWRPRGFSMEPAIRDGDRVLIAPVEPDRLRVGDVVKYRAGDELRMHRLVKTHSYAGDHLFVLRGDRGTSEDTVPAAAVIGRALAVERSGRVRRLDSATDRWRIRLRGWLGWNP